MSRRSFLASVTSLASNASDTDCQALAANESTVALIPKVEPRDGSGQKTSSSQLTSATAATSQPSITAPSNKPQEKDWEAAFAQLSSTMGFTGSVPTIPQGPKPSKKTASKKQAAKSKQKAAASSSATSAQSNDTSNQAEPSKKGKSSSASVRQQCVRIEIGLTGIWVQWVLDSYSPGGQKKDNTKSLKTLEKLGHRDLKLDEYESQIAAEVIHPDDIDVTFAGALYIYGLLALVLPRSLDIGGLDPIISSLRESVIYPLQFPHLFSSSSLLGAPKGVLLYGPPGCGKTMLAKALAKESGATFINIAASVLTNKWYGESNKLVAGLFSLARKTQPSIVFIDEIDSFLRERTSNDHEVTGMMKAEFMTLWDGLLSGSDRILVLGATNRPNDIDSAILRRMPKRFSVGLPDLDQRLKILSLLLKDTNLVPDFPLVKLGERTEGKSGSDLKDFCRNAAMVPMREIMREADSHDQLQRVAAKVRMVISSYGSVTEIAHTHRTGN
ncbi:hypothetical protein EIP86_009509 [Pleurotus ostreatoroseus]|nr:hypothetical protein EIP86_009509 [Pleurotus ostreatoroseus]